MHNNSHIIIHVIANIFQEQRSDDANPSKPNTSVIHPLVALGIGDPPRSDDRVVGGFVACDAGDVAEFVEEGRACEFDGFGDVGCVGDVEFCEHDAADVVCGAGDEFGDEDVVVDCVADAAADDADGEGEGGDGGD